MQVWPVDPEGPLPPFEQLRTQIASRAASGDLPSGTKLPTVRALAAELGLAAGTVARSYRELEADGVVVTEGRRGTFVAPSVAASSTEADDAARTLVAQARQLGLSLPDAQRLVEQHW